jgi:hypothetical protein
VPHPVRSPAPGASLDLDLVLDLDLDVDLDLDLDLVLDPTPNREEASTDCSFPTLARDPETTSVGREPGAGRSPTGSPGVSPGRNLAQGPSAFPKPLQVNVLDSVRGLC